MSINKTPNLGLNQWALSDKPAMDEFNEDNKKIDEWTKDIGDPSLLAKLTSPTATNWDSGSLSEEKGSWEVSVSGKTTAGTVTYEARESGYYRLGDMIIASWYLDFALLGAVGELQLTGVPFINKGTRISGNLMYGYGIIGQEGNMIVPSMVVGDNTITLRSLAGGNSTDLLAQTHFRSDKVILQGSIVYYK